MFLNTWTDLLTLILNVITFVCFSPNADGTWNLELYSAVRRDVFGTSKVLSASFKIGILNRKYVENLGILHEE